MSSYRPNYQRSVGGGRTVDTGPPRTNTGLTGLGAVGGATGVGAGAIRVLVEFLTQYDSKELKQLENELARLQKVEDRHNTRAAALRKQEAQSQVAVTRVRNLHQRAELNFTRAQQRELLNIRDLERSRVRGSKQQADAAKALLAQQTGFTKSQISQLVNRDRIEQRALQRKAQFTAAIAKEESTITRNLERQAPIQQRLSFMQNLRANLAPKLGSLALGAAGGIFGGAIIGLGFAAAQALIDLVGGALRDIFDPANKAREAIKGVTEEINKLAEAKGLSNLEATREYLKEIGDFEGIDTVAIADSAALENVRVKLEKIAELLDIIENPPTSRQDLITQRFRQLVETSAELRRATEADQRVGGPFGAVFGDRTRAVNAQLMAQAIREVDAALGSANGRLGLAARQEQALASAGAIAAISQNRLADALRNIAGVRISGLQEQISGLGGPSARTQALQNQLEGLAEAQASNNYQSQLNQIQEQRALILLERRIRFQGQSVDLDRLSARAQLVAIDARISALQRAGEAERAQLEAVNAQADALRRADAEQDKRDQKALEVYDKRIAAIRKEGEEQDRFNQLLDLQYRLSQDIERSQGESIGDFLARRANEQRKLLAEQQSLGREGQISVIQAERDKLAAQLEVANQRREAAIEAKELEAQQLQATIDRIEKARQAEIDALNQRREQLQLEVRLQELAEQEKDLAAQEADRKHQKRIADQLKRSQEADQKAVESRRKALEEQVKAEQEKLERALYWTNLENQERLRLAARGANTYAEVQAISGEVAGARRVLGELRALVQAGVLPYEFVSERIANLVQIIRLAESRMSQVITGRGAPGSSGFQPGFATGGVFDLTNGTANPFNMNIRAGEQGRELGIILSNRVARILQETSSPRLPAQNFVINRSDDPFRDRNRFGRVVKDAVSDALR